MDNPTLMITGFVHVSIHCPDVMRQSLICNCNTLDCTHDKSNKVKQMFENTDYESVSLKLLGNLGVAEVVRR